MIKPIQIQIFGWIIIVIIPVIFFVAIKPEKTAQLKEKKRIVCSILMGIFALGFLSNLLSLFRLGIPHIARQFLSLWGFLPAVTALLFPLLKELPMTTARWYNFPLLNILFFGGMIFFFAKKATQLKESDSSLIGDKKQHTDKTSSNGTFGFAIKIGIIGGMIGGIIGIFGGFPGAFIGVILGVILGAIFRANKNAAAKKKELETEKMLAAVDKAKRVLMTPDAICHRCSYLRNNFCVFAFPMSSIDSCSEWDPPGQGYDEDD